MSLAREYIISALDAEKSGELFPIRFEEVWETFGFQVSTGKKHSKGNTKRYITERSGLKMSGNPNGLPTKLTEAQLGLLYTLDKRGGIHFSIDSYKFSLARANTPEGYDYLIYLIQVEKQYRRNLELQVQAQFKALETEIKESKLTALDVPGFPRTLEELHKNSGIVSKSQVKIAITRDFIEDHHYQYEGKKLVISEQCYLVLMLSFRSKRGCTVDMSQDIKRIDWTEIADYERRRKANTRLPKKSKVVEGQLSLFDSSDYGIN